MNGLTSTVANLYNTFEPDVKISAARGKYFEPTKQLLSTINSVQGVKLVSQTINDKALIKNFDKQALVSIKGVDDKFRLITKIEASIEEGGYGLNDSGSVIKILLGKGIATQLQVNLNSYVNDLNLYSPIRGKSGSINPEDELNNEHCLPSGIFTLNDEFDFQYAFVNIETARKLFDAGNRITAFEIKCDEGATDKVREALKEKLGPGFVVKNRYELNDVLFKSLETEKLATFIILAFILVIATFNIIGALTMLIIEKRKDIKTLHSMGADLQLVRNIFMREGLLITGIGALMGLLLGLFVCWLQLQFHLVKFGNEFVVPYYPIELQFNDFVWMFCLIMAIGFLAALYPVRVFTKTDLIH